MNTESECYVQGIGTAVPSGALTAEDSVGLLQQACATPRLVKLLRRVVRLTGIEKRHLAVLDYQSKRGGRAPLYLPFEQQPQGPGMGARNALFDEASTPLVLEALAAFGGQHLATVNTLITASCTHASSPGLEHVIFLRTAVRPAVDRWNLGFMGCSAGLAAMRLVHQGRRRGASALIVVCELSSLHFQYSERLDQLTANVLFADGAGAMLLSSERSGVRLVDCRCAALPEAADQMVWFADDHGLRLDLSQDLPDTLGAHLPATVDAFLGDNGLTRSAVDHWLVHPGGPQILDSVQQCLALAEDALGISRGILHRYGNMSSPTIFFIMRELFEQNVGGLCVAIAFGPGLTIELTLLELDRGAGGRPGYSSP